MRYKKKEKVYKKTNEFKDIKSIYELLGENRFNIFFYKGLKGSFVFNIRVYDYGRYEQLGKLSSLNLNLYSLGRYGLLGHNEYLIDQLNI